MTNEPAWHETHSNIVDLATSLVEHGFLTTADEMLDFIETPWSWTPEWEYYSEYRDPATNEVSWDAYDPDPWVSPIPDPDGNLSEITDLDEPHARTGLRVVCDSCGEAHA